MPGAVGGTSGSNTLGQLGGSGKKVSSKARELLKGKTRPTTVKVKVKVKLK